MTLTVEVTVNASIQNVWNCWTQPEHIVQWNFASDEWCCPNASNDLNIGGKFNWRMEAKDGSMGFDYWGIYTDIQPLKSIDITLGDDRKVEITFIKNEAGVRVLESFETEDENTAELQRNGWQSILNNFKKHVESL